MSNLTNHHTQHIHVQRNDSTGSKITEIVQYMSFSTSKEAINTIKDVECNNNKSVRVTQNNGVW
jgi:hypothetical protein